VVALINGDAAVHFRRIGDLLVAVQFQFRIDAADILPAHQGDPPERGADGEMLPVMPGNIGRTQSPGEDRQPHLDLGIPPVFGFRVDDGENRRIGTAFNSRRQTLRAQSIALDVQMRIVNRIVLIGTSRDLTERTRIEDFPPSEGSPENLAIPSAAVDAAGTDAAHGDHILGPIKG